MICIQSFYQIKRPHFVGNEWTDYVQQLVVFAHGFPRFSAMNNKSRPNIPEFLPNIFRVLEGLAGYPTVMSKNTWIFPFQTELSINKNATRKTTSSSPINKSINQSINQSIFPRSSNFIQKYMKIIAIGYEIRVFQSD